MLKAIHAQEDTESAKEKAASVASKLQSMKLNAAAKILAGGINESVTYYQFP